MEPESLSDKVPIFNAANPETLTWLGTVSEQYHYPANTVLVEPEDWGKAVTFIVSGWVAVSTQIKKQEKTLSLLGTGDYFGDIAVFDDYPPFCRAIALSEVKLLSLSAQRFLQLLLKDSQLQQRMLQATTQRLRYLYTRLKATAHSASYQVIRLLMHLAESYGKTTEKGIEIFQLSETMIADLVNSHPDEITSILDSLIQSKLLVINPEKQRFYLPNLKQLPHFYQ